MLIGKKLKEIRESKKLQSDIEERTGLRRCYTSRVESGHTIPSVETMSKYARALQIPLYEFFHDGKGPIRPNLVTYETQELWGEGGDEKHDLDRFIKAFSRMNERNLKLFLALAAVFARQKRAN